MMAEEVALTDVRSAERCTQVASRTGIEPDLCLSDVIA
jgi:hypothetical protein